MGDKTEHLVGLGNNAEIETNERGGSQSKAGYRFDLIDTTAIFGLAEVCKKGAEKYGVDNWRLIGRREHVNHAIIHLYAWLAGDKQEKHLEHAFTRIMFAIGTTYE